MAIAVAAGSGGGNVVTTSPNRRQRLRPGARKAARTHFGECHILRRRHAIGSSGRGRWQAAQHATMCRSLAPAGRAHGVSCALKRAAMRHVVDERNRICKTWKMHRWASFRMNTPVSEVRPIGNDFEVRSPAGTAIARSVVIATGKLDVPRRPGAIRSTGLPFGEPKWPHSQPPSWPRHPRLTR